MSLCLFVSFCRKAWCWRKWTQLCCCSAGTTLVVLQRPPGPETGTVKSCIVWAASDAKRVVLPVLVGTCFRHTLQCTLLCFLWDFEYPKYLHATKILPKMLPNWRSSSLTFLPWALFVGTSCFATSPDALVCAHTGWQSHALCRVCQPHLTWRTSGEVYSNPVTIGCVILIITGFLHCLSKHEWNKWMTTVKISALSCWFCWKVILP